MRARGGGGGAGREREVRGVRGGVTGALDIYI